MATRQVSRRMRQIWKVFDMPSDVETLSVALQEAAIRAGFATKQGAVPPPDRLIRDPVRLCELIRFARLKFGNRSIPAWVICESLMELKKAKAWPLQNCGDRFCVQDWESTCHACGWRGSADALRERMLDLFSLLHPAINDEQLCCEPTLAVSFLHALEFDADISLDPIIDWPVVLGQLANARRRSDPRACQGSRHATADID